MSRNTKEMKLKTSIYRQMEIEKILFTTVTCIKVLNLSLGMISDACIKIRILKKNQFVPRKKLDWNRFCLFFKHHQLKLYSKKVFSWWYLKSLIVAKIVETKAFGKGFFTFFSNTMVLQFLTKKKIVLKQIHFHARTISKVLSKTIINSFCYIA